MSEYIDRDLTVQKIVNIGNENYEGKYPNIGMVHAAQIVKSMPSSDVAPVIHAEWISFLYGENIMPERYYRCSKCGRVERRREPYCHCGAKMD